MTCAGYAGRRLTAARPRASTRATTAPSCGVRAATPSTCSASSAGWRPARTRSARCAGGPGSIRARPSEALHRTVPMRHTCVHISVCTSGGACVCGCWPLHTFVRANRTDLATLGARSFSVRTVCAIRRCEELGCMAWHETSPRWQQTAVRVRTDLNGRGLCAARMHACGSRPA